MSKTPTIVPQQGWDSNSPSFALQAQEAMKLEAQIATQIAERIAATSVPTEQINNGVQLQRVMTAREVAGRACDIASELYHEFQNRGFLVELPEPHELQGLVRQGRNTGRGNSVGTSGGGGDIHYGDRQTSDGQRQQRRD